jgi:hypothetical protein
MNDKIAKATNGEPSRPRYVAPSAMTSPLFNQPAIAASGRATAAVLALLLLSACSQEVVLIPLQSDESNPLPAATRAEVDAACSDLCTGSFECQVWDGFCQTNCESVIIEGCEAEAKAIIDCLDRLAPEECSLTTLDCLKEVIALNECAPPSYCVGSAILTLPNGCSSSGLCGGDILVEECLDNPADGTRTCTCYFGDEPVKVCENAGQVCGFDMYSGSCCSSVPV